MNGNSNTDKSLNKDFVSSNLGIAENAIPQINSVYAANAYQAVPITQAQFAYAYNNMAYTNSTPGLSYSDQLNSYYSAYHPYSYAAAYNYYSNGETSVNNQVNNNVEEPNKSLNKNKKNDKEKDTEENEEDEDDDPTVDNGNKSSKLNNVLPFWGNEKTMNLNQLILTNILQSPYFKTNLYQLKTYHEVIDEIYYQVKHLEPWERGSRKVSGQTGMCGSVRGVGAGGIVSTPFCILYKLFTLKLTRKQLNGLIKHKDSPFIRAIGFMYIRYTQPPSNFWQWFEPYLEDTEELEVKSGLTMTIGEMCKHFMTKLDWFSTLFPRMPIPVQKELEKKLSDYEKSKKKSRSNHLEDGELDDEDNSSSRKGNSSRMTHYNSKNRNSRNRSRSRSRSKERDRYYSRRRSRSRSKDRSRRSNSKSRDKYRRNNDSKRYY